jgi:hypothetical protein
VSMSAARDLPGHGATAPPRSAPVWLFVATAVLGLLILVMAVAETTLWLHYLIDGGEYVSLAGLVFIGVVGALLYRQRRLVASLPLVAPWLLFPVITQGDQIIDNLSIGPMRIITHAILAAIFAMPVVVVVLAARSALLSRPHLARSTALGLIPGLRLLAEGRAREGTALFAASLLAAEILVAVAYLGSLMVVTLAALVIAVLCWGSRPSPGATAATGVMRAERSALTMLLAGVVLSFGLYIGYKNRPGAYQGSPSFLMDPQQREAGYPMDRIPAGTGPVAVPAANAPLGEALTGYGRALRRLVDGYYILDRNYTWHFHNELFVQHTPLLPDYRTVALDRIQEAREMSLAADAAAAMARPSVSDDNPLAALLDDVRAYVAFNRERAARLESMSAGFEQSKAGLQHAAHLYEGEGKLVAMLLEQLLTKHGAALGSPAAAPVVGHFATDARTIIDAYAARVVGF